MNMIAKFIELNELSVDVVEEGRHARKNTIACELGRNITFSTELLESFSSTNWQAIVYDALVVAAAVEFCDGRLVRSTMNWGRRFNLRIPVHEYERWRSPAVSDALADALNLLTGDDWRIEFSRRHKKAETPTQNRMEFPTDAQAVIAYSEGMDSRAVGGLEGKRLGTRLVRVRVGTKKPEGPKSERYKKPFAAVPYDVDVEANNTEPTARSRGFKFALVAAIASYLISAPEILMTESGQGSLAPAALPVGQGYPDYRSHPVFMRRVERLALALFGNKVSCRFPRLWRTKGETLREFVDVCDPDPSVWISTWSCWQQSRHSSVAGTKRQCGVCAACILRRMSVHGAGLAEPQTNYVWENLRASSFEDGASAEFDRARITPAMREYALAGVLHAEHFASMRESDQYALLKRRVEGELSRALGEPLDAVAANFDRLLKQHRKEWRSFTDQLGDASFVRLWIDRKS
jgi:hypothetical protein